jgi:signal transduction histidine kinase
MAGGIQGVLPPAVPVDGGTLTRRRRLIGGRGEEMFVFPLVVRRAAWCLALGGVVAVAAATRPVRGEEAHLTWWVLTTAVFALPGLALTWRAGGRVAPVDRPVWRLWFAGFCVSVVGGAALLTLSAHDWGWARALWVASVVLSVLCYGAGNMVIMRTRAGQRAPGIDVVDLTTFVVVVTAPVALVVGDAVVTSDAAWYTVSWSVITVALVHGVAVAAVFAARIAREDRGLAWVGLALGVAALVDAAGQVALAMDGFAAASGPLLTWHALACGLGIIFVVHAMRRPSVGLDRLPPEAQVRRRNVVSGLVLAAVPVIVADAALGRNEAWVLAGAGATVVALLVLSSVRHLLVARETARLYHEVDQAAGERRRLLADVIHHVDTDRYRMAARLHQQAMSSYSAMATFVTALEMSPPGRPGAALAMVASQTRTDLAQQVDALRDMLEAMAPARGDGQQRLVAPLRAYVDSLYGDGCRPDLHLEVDESLAPDWTTEVLALRIIHAALDNVHRHSRCRSLTVRVTPRGQTVIIEVVDDGVGFDPRTAEAGTGITTMRTLADHLDGSVEVTAAPGGGTHVRAVLGAPGPPGRRPVLRLVTDGSL